MASITKFEIKKSKSFVLKTSKIFAIMNKRKTAKKQTHLTWENPNYKVVAMVEFQTSYNGFLNFLSYDVWSCHSINGSIKFYDSQPYKVSHMTRT